MTPLSLFFILLFLLVSPNGLWGQPREKSVLENPGPPPDSVSLLREAKEAQKAFELHHRNHLPRVPGQWEVGCDERMGNMCLRFEGSMGWEPPQEDPSVAGARMELLETLERIGGQIPGDRWVLGQRIRYLGDLSRWNVALSLARDCRGPPEWWCSGLQGYALHRSGRPLEAEKAFRRALELMDPVRAAGWWDPSLLLDYRGGQWLKNPGGLSREEAVRRFWTLADPLFLTPGNERLSEHFARRFGANLLRESELTLGVDWSSSLEAILVRYGFGVGWERTSPGLQDYGGGTVVEHHHPEARGLLPPAEALQDPPNLQKGAWVPLDERPRSASAPVLAPLVVEGRAEKAVFRREGGLLVVVSFDLPTDTLLQKRRNGGPDGEHAGGRRPFGEPLLEEATTDTLVGLFLLADTGSWRPLRRLSRGESGILQLRAPAGRYLLSLEQWSPTARWAARVREGLVAEAVPPDVPVLSDLLILDADVSTPERLENALPRMRSSAELASGERVSVGWEVYGLGYAPVPLTFRLSLIHQEGNLVRRALERIGLFRRDPVLTLSWTEDGPERVGPFFRAVDLDLPAMDPGAFVLQLALDMPGRTQVISQRRVRVR